jgi:rhodanese-related sulfurtransferase
VLAIGNTNSHDEQHKHNLNLMKQLADSFIGNMTDAGFAPDAMISVTLKDSRTAPAILCGNKLIAQVSLNTGTKTGAVYLLDNAKEHPDHQHLQATFAFTGDIETNPQNTNAQSAGLLAEIGEGTLLCAAHDFEKLLVTTVHMHELAATENMTVDSCNLSEFVQAHPGAILVDVREPYEQALSNFTVPDGIEVIHMPITRLANGIEHWMKQSAQTSVPLVFFCRSGGRSVQAVQCMRRLGYQQAWHVAGGLALWQH